MSMRFPFLRVAVAALVLLAGAVFLFVAQHDSEAVQAGALVYIAFLMTVAVVTRKWL